MNPEQITALLTEIKGDFVKFQAKADEEIKNAGQAHNETKEALVRLQRQVDALDALRQTVNVGKQQKSLASELKESESFQRLLRDGRGTAVIKVKGGLPSLEQKTTIDTSAVGTETSGVLRHDREAGIETQAMRRLTIRDLLPSAPTSETAVDFVKVNAFTSAASPQVESSAKGESALTFTTDAETVRTLAHWIPASKQILADMPGLMEMIRTELIYGLKLKEEQQLLTGSGTGNDLNGLVTQATAFSTALMGSGIWHKADLIRRAIQQVFSADQTMPDWVVMNPVDFADIELTKDTARQYLSGYGGTINQPFAKTLWGLRVLETPSMTSGTFLVGNSIKATIRDREEVSVEISTEHSDYFVKNLVAIRCEERLCLVVRRPASYITGTFTTSP